MCISIYIAAFRIRCFCILNLELDEMQAFLFESMHFCHILSTECGRLTQLRLHVDLVLSCAFVPRMLLMQHLHETRSKMPFTLRIL